MKLTTLLLIAGFLQVSASAQKISLHEKDADLIHVFEKISSQTGFDFLVTKTMINIAHKVTIDVQNGNLPDVLDAIFKNQPFLFKITDKSVLVKWKQDPAEQEKEKDTDRRGKVMDENKTPLPGATLRVKGTDKVFNTAADGSFVLKNVDGKAVIIVSFIGYQSKEITADKIGDVITLNSKIASLGEVQVTTAYGIEKRTKELGYSVAKVSGEEINRANSGNVLQGLIGKVSGMNITAQSSDMNPQMRILIRGIRSFGQTSNNQPLFILNGSPLSFGSDQDAQQLALNFINNINPADIEDVTILKGANGTAIYGPEGVNGVIIITTKKGAKGEFAVNFRNNTSFQKVDYRNDYRQRKFGLGAGNLDEFGNGVYNPTAAYSWGPIYDGHMVPIGNPDANGNYQMVKYEDTKQAQKFFDVAHVNRTNLSISQSDEKSSFYFGLGYISQTGLLPGDKQNQATFLLNTTRRIGKLTTQININFARKNDDRGPDVGDIIKSLPTFIPILKYKDYVNDYWAQPDNFYNGISPYQTLDIRRTKLTSNALALNFSLEYKPLRWLSIMERPGVNYSGEYSKSKTLPVYFSDYAHTLPGKYTDYPPGVGDYSGSSTALNNDLILSTIHTAGNFVIKTNVGNSIRQNFSKDLRSGAILAIPVYNVAFAKYPAGITDLEALARTVSVFGNTMIGYKDCAFLELTGRNEWDSKRAKVARGKDLYFGANTSLVLNEISPALGKLTWLSNARLRSSFAISANMNISPYQFERILGLSGGYPYGDLISYGFAADKNPNPLLKPERVFSQEYGLNLGFFQNRITLDMVYYYQKNNSVILDVKNPFLSGAPTIDNAGAFQNHGFEFDLKLNPLFKLPNGMALIVDGRFAINDNKVLKLSDVYKGVFRGDDGNSNPYYARTGHSAYEFAVTDWKRDPEGRVIVDKNTGMPMNDDYGVYQIYGKTLPKYTASIGLNFVWKNFTATVLADASSGNDHLFSTSGDFYAGIHPLTNLNNREKFVFPHSSYDDGTGKYVANEDVVVSTAGQGLYSLFSNVNVHGLVNAAFLKIRELSLQYKVPFKRGPVKDILISAYARDLFNFYPSSNIIGDPGLTRGVGTREFIPLNSNLDGGSSSTSVLPGTILYGFILSCRF
jgi:TonB-linked SusC/RagA family outer membrane protein